MTVLSSFELLLFSIISCAILTRYAISFFTKLGIVDIPSTRRIHSNITPLCGGTSIVLTFIIGLALYDFVTLNHNTPYSYFSFPLGIAAAISLFDDIKPLTPGVRLIAHLAVAAFVINTYLNPKTLFHNELPMTIDYVIALLSLATFMNIYNFMDGIDGITSVESIHLSLTIISLCILRHEYIEKVDFILSMATLVLGSSVSFLYFNWHPAKIFLGDVGSISLGLILGLCLILLASSEHKLFVSAVIASLYYVADGGGTILLRIVKGEKIWLPHLNHFFQQAVRKGMSHNEISKKIAICNFILMVLSIGALYYPIISLAFALIITLITLVHFSK